MSFENKISLLTGYLAKFSELPQFEVLSGVLVAELLDDIQSFPSEFSLLSFEMLAQQSGQSLLREYSLDEFHIEKLLTLLQQFVPTTEVPAELPSNEVTPEEFFRAFSSEESENGGGEETYWDDSLSPQIPRLSSIEAERQLLSRYRSLRESLRFDEMKRLRISDYWEKERVRDPFIEELTFREVLEISVPHLLQKKTFTETKVYCLLKAFDRLFQDFDVSCCEEN